MKSSSEAPRTALLKAAPPPGTVTSPRLVSQSLSWAMGFAVHTCPQQTPSSPGRGRARTGVGHSRTPHLNPSRARDGLSRCLLSEWRHSHMLYLPQQVNDRGRVLPGSSRLQSTQSFTRVPHSVTTQKPPRRKDPREEQGREVRPRSGSFMLPRFSEGFLSCWSPQSPQVCFFRVPAVGQPLCLARPLLSPCFPHLLQGSRRSF